MRPLNIGLSEQQRQGTIEILNRDLSDFYLLNIKTKKYHWDVVGPQFRSLHEIWEEHYEILSVNIDETAERIRALGGYPVGTAAGFLEHATIKEHDGDVPTANEMVEDLVVTHEQIIRNLREDIDSCSEKYHDEGTADFITGLMEQHEEMAWMLRSFIEGENLAPNGKSAVDTKVPAKV
ncbi:MAG: Dps family protein [Oscillatoria sp. PMC 1051.18]|nr:Dps family protein [Oscillatoria sp. PMC 1050.18]MEC5030525.1 Dps family protein [Oscillatoria sp. PMC 1051.18]